MLQRNYPGGIERKKKATTHAVPLLSEEEITELAKRFSQAIPEDELSVRQLALMVSNSTVQLHSSTPPPEHPQFL